eukprot:scaffold23251_cov27-Tisochrysis_lutea.AAC.2
MGLVERLAQRSCDDIACNEMYIDGKMNLDGALPSSAKNILGDWPVAPRGHWGSGAGILRADTKCRCAK